MNETAVYEIRLKDSFSGPLKGMESKMNVFEKSFSSFGKDLLSVFGGNLLAGGVRGVLEGVKDLGVKIVTLGAQMEQTRVSFETMLGSSKAADGFIKQLQTFANITPYVTSEVLDAGKQMLAFGFSSQEVIPQLTRLGDVASGLSIPLGDMIYLYGTLKTQGKAMTKDIMQFAQRGIPIYDSLAKVLGVSKDKVGDLVTAGKVGFNQVSKAFELMTAKGSMFGGLMDKQSRTLAGRWSTFQGILETIGTTLGEKMLPVLGAVVDSLTEFANILPSLDFSSIIDQYKDLFSAGKEIIDMFRELFNVTGISTDKFTIFQTVIQGLSFTIRGMLTPLRSMILTIKTLMQGVIATSKAFVELYDLAKNISSGNFKKAGVNLDNIKKIGAEFGNQISDTVSKEIQGWKNIFKFPGKKKEDENAATTGTTKNGLSGSASMEAKASGVEKIQAGTRNVTINITKLVDTVNISKTFGRNSDSELVDAVKRALLTGVNDVNIIYQ